MKKILLKILLFISIVTFSQEKLKGKYCSIPIGESDVTCIDFKEKKRFDYVISGCLGDSEIGSGIFELKNDILKLIFDKKKQTYKSLIKIKEFKPKLEEKVSFKFKITDESDYSLYANVVKKRGNIDFGTFETNIEISQNKNDSIAEYRIFSLGYELVELELDNKTDKVIEIKLSTFQPKLISEKTFTWSLIEIKKNEFKTGKEFWNTFRKIEN
jgi:hypothetical protein